MRFIRRYCTFWVTIFVLLLAACSGEDSRPQAPYDPAPNYDDGAPYNPAPTDGEPYNPAPTYDDGAPYDGAPYDGAPYDGAPYDPAPEGPYDPGAPAPEFPGSLDYYSPEEVSDLEEYLKKCQHLNRDFEEGNIVYSPTERMRRGNSDVIEVAATLRTEVPPPVIVKSEGGEVIGSQVRVSCVIEAELRGDAAEFDIQEQGWQLRSLLTSPTARWTWSVTPKRGGNHELVLAVRPVIAREDGLGNPLRHADVEASVLTYRIMVDVSVSPDEWLGKGFDRVTALLTSAKGMVVALTSLVVAAAAIRWRRAKSLSNSATPD